jgi:hypothetical protein
MQIPGFQYGGFTGIGKQGIGLTAGIKTFGIH